MRAHWFSQQGLERTRNSDAAAVRQLGKHLLAALVDGAEKGPRGAELARHWAEALMQALTEVSTRSQATVDACLRQAHAQLRHDSLSDIASYCMVSLDLDTLATHVWHCGDCRVGLQLPTETRWLTMPHILAHQPGLPSARSPEKQERREQQLTRSLNARRFCPPEHQVFPLQQGQTLLLSTDGYWQEHLEAGTPRRCLQDDASLLTLSVGPGALVHVEQVSDTDNLLL